MIKPDSEQSIDSKLIGIAGPFAAGKDTAARHLMDLGFMHVSTGDILRAEATKRGLDWERQTLIDISIDLHEQYGNRAVMVLKGIELWQSQRQQYIGGLVISGIRVLDEALELQRQHGIMTYIDGPPELRYEHAKQRAIEEGRTIELKNINSLTDFVASEQNEYEGIEGPGRPNLKAIKEIADVRIWNDGTKAQFIQELIAKLGLAA